jgi:hypothetical protein
MVLKKDSKGFASKSVRSNAEYNRAAIAQEPMPHSNEKRRRREGVTLSVAAP